jgi:hypothetical protein
MLLLKGILLISAEILLGILALIVVVHWTRPLEVPRQFGQPHSSAFSQPISATLPVEGVEQVRR